MIQCSSFLLILLQALGGVGNFMEVCGAFWKVEMPLSDGGGALDVAGSPLSCGGALADNASLAPKTFEHCMHTFP